MDKNLAGHEEDIRQSAVIILLNEYLTQNHDLTVAAKNEDIKLIEETLQRCVSSALSIAAKRIRKKRRKIDIREISLDQNHPAMTSAISAASEPIPVVPQDCHRVVEAAIRRALRNDRLDHAAAKAIRSVLKSPRKLKEIAADLEISPWSLSILCRKELKF